MQKREKKAGRIFDQTMTENFTNFVKNINLETQ